MYKKHFQGKLCCFTALVNEGYKLRKRTLEPNDNLKNGLD